jgi:hypothetical protein
MESGSDQEREIRAARNQSLFRAVNEKLRGVSAALEAANESFVVACECADTSCLEMLEIAPQEYISVRENPRRFVVLAGHIYPDVEIVVEERATHVVVEKLAAAGLAAEEFAEQA